MTDKSIEQVSAGMTATNEFGSQSIQATGETVATVLAARAKAEVEARFIMAMNRPRDWDNVRSKMLKACERPGFAGLDKRKGEHGQAWWSKPVGKDGSIEGFSIRFAEEALRNMGNMDARSAIVWEDDKKRIVEVLVMDLESNISIPTTVIVEKTIERKYLKKGEVAISTRLNSYGEPVHLREATADEVNQMQNSLISKAMRNAILRLLPGDIQTECRKRIIEIRHGDIAKDPEGFKRKVLDGFAEINVEPSSLKEYLGHDVATSSQSELMLLRDLWKEIQDGKTTWHQVLEAKALAEGEEPAEPKEPMQKLKDDLKSKGSKGSK